MQPTHDRASSSKTISFICCFLACFFAAIALCERVSATKLDGAMVVVFVGGVLEKPATT